MGQLTCGIAIPGVFEKDGSYYKVIKNKWHKLSRIDEGERTLLRAIATLDPIRPGTLAELMRMYQASGMDHLKPATKVDYEHILKRLAHHFGDITVNTLRPNQVAHFLETRRRAGRGATRANREFAVLSAVHDWGMRQLYVESNPCHGVRRNTEKPRKTYVTDEAFLEIFNKANRAFQDLIAVAYLTGIRQTDLIAMDRKAHLTPRGIEFIESKTGKAHVQEWSDAVRYFVRRAMERCPEADVVLTNTYGHPWTVSGIASQIARLKAPWCFKDLRAKGQTDKKGSLLGHGAQLEAVYRKVIYTSPVR